jgi:LPXTG-site transpeptidase (sortase) family protein
VSRRSLTAIGVVVVLVLVLAGGVAVWLGRDGDGDGSSEPAALSAVAGPDVAAEQPASNPAIDGGTGMFTEEYLLAVLQALRIQQMEQEAAEARAAYAAARVEGERVAAAAIRAWGANQLLLAMPSINVTAAVSGIGYERDGRTPSTPNTPWGVGWYTFTDFPGTAGNAVFSGHVDWYTGAPAVFGRLRGLEMGDQIYMVLADGTPIAYKVEREEWVTPYNADVAEIFGVTEREALTFITCGGAWDPVAHDYSHRLIVRAYRGW